MYCWNLCFKANANIISIQNSTIVGFTVSELIRILSGQGLSFLTRFGTINSNKNNIDIFGKSSVQPSYGTSSGISQAQLVDKSSE